MAEANVTRTFLTGESYDRFWAKVDKNGPFPDQSDPLITAPATRCWVWTAATTMGYGVFGATNTRYGRTVGAHRVSYIENVGEISDGHHVDHLCRNRSCVNPDHLEAVTHRENILRGATVPAQRATVTHCLQGHEYNEANTWVSPRRQRQCRACHREREAAKRLDPAVKAARATEARAYRARLKASAG